MEAIGGRRNVKKARRKNFTSFTKERDFIALRFDDVKVGREKCRYKSKTGRYHRGQALCNRLNELVIRHLQIEN